MKTDFSQYVLPTNDPGWLHIASRSFSFRVSGRCPGARRETAPYTPIPGAQDAPPLQTPALSGDFARGAARWAQLGPWLQSGPRTT